MSAVIGGVEITNDIIKVLNKLNEANDDKPLTKGKLKNLEVPLAELVQRGFVTVTKERRTDHYKLNDSGKAFFNSIPEELLKPKRSKSSSGALKVTGEDVAYLRSRLDILDQKVDRILAILSQPQAKPGDVRSDPADMKADAFERQLIDEYKKLRSREFLSDGKVWHEQLKKILIERYNYKDYEYDELLYGLKRSRIGMITLSQGKDKTWIEIKA